jgi:DNA-binding response OmpR family regulator
MSVQRVLIVDGDSDSRAVYRILLQHHGFEVVEAADGAVALHAVAAAPIDVVVMELTLRRLDGHALLERLVAESPGLRVVVLTARALEADRLRAERAGCMRYLTKPLEPQALLRQVRELLDDGT